MAIQLSKGGRINLTKTEPGLQKVGIGLGWDTNQYSGSQFDLDASVFLLGENGKIPSEEYFIFYNNLTSPDKSVEHKGDNRTGAGDGDDETVYASLDSINSQISEILFVATIHDAKSRQQNFGQIRNAYIRIYNQLSGEEIAKYELDEDFSYETGLEFGRLYHKNGEWRFMATGQGYENGLQGFVDKYA